MDPNATLYAMNESSAARDWSDAIEHGTNLLEWLAKGGFPPAGYVTRGDAESHVRAVIRNCEDNLS